MRYTIAALVMVLVVVGLVGCMIFSRPIPCGMSCQPADTAGPDNFDLREFPFTKEWI